MCTALRYLCQWHFRHVCQNFPLCVTVCLWVCDCKFLSVCQYLCVWGYRCFVSLMRGVRGLRGGWCKIIFSCFAMKALLNVTEETHSNGGGLGWIIQHLQSILAPTSSWHLPGPQGLQAHHGNVDNSPYNAFSGPLATWEAMGAWVFVWVCNLVCWIIKCLKCCFIALSVRFFFFYFLSFQRNLRTSPEIKQLQVKPGYINKKKSSIVTVLGTKVTLQI